MPLIAPTMILSMVRYTCTAMTDRNSTAQGGRCFSASRHGTRWKHTRPRTLLQQLRQPTTVLPPQIRPYFHKSPGPRTSKNTPAMAINFTKVFRRAMGLN